MTSTPAAKSSSAIFGVMPRPPATFSPLTTTNVGVVVLAQARQQGRAACGGRGRRRRRRRRGCVAGRVGTTRRTLRRSLAGAVTSADGRRQALRRSRGRAARRLASRPPPARSSRSSGPTAPARRRCCRSSPACWRRRRDGRRSAPRRGRLGAAAAGGLPQALRRREPAALRAARGRRRRRRRPSRGCSSRPGSRDRAGRRARHALAAATSSASTSRSACSPTRRSCCSTSRPPRWTRASASGCGSSSAALARDGTTVVFSTHDVGEAERYADRVLVLADGELLFDGTPDALDEAGSATTRDFEAAFVRFLARAGPLRCAGCCVKDLQILRRSPLLVGAARRLPDRHRRCSSGSRCPAAPDKPKVAFVNEVPRRRTASSSSAARRLDASRYAERAVRGDRPGPRRLARGGDREGARRRGARRADRPRGHRASSCRARSTSRAAPSRRRSRCSTTPRTRSRRSYVESTIKARLAEANQALGDRLTKVAAGYLDILLRGGEFSLLGRQLRRARACSAPQQILDAVAARRCRPARRTARRSSRSSRFADARDRQPRPRPARCSASIGSPIAVEADGRSRAATTPLDGFAVAVAVTISLMFVAVLLGAGMLALEREEHAFGAARARARLAHGGCVVEKVVLGALCAFVVALRAARGCSALRLDLDCGRRAAVARGARASARSAFGAIGRRDRRAGARRARGVAAGVPALAADRVPRARPVGRGVRRALRRDPRVVGALFPFKPTLEALDAALNDAGAGARAPARAPRRARRRPTASLARLALRRFGAPVSPSVAARCASSGATTGDPAVRARATSTSCARSSRPTASSSRRGSRCAASAFFTAGRAGARAAPRRRGLGRGQRATRSRSLDRADGDAARSAASRWPTSSAARGSNATIGYWVAGASAARGHATDAVAARAARSPSSTPGLHRVQPAIIPRNAPLRRAWRRRPASASRAARCAT